MNSGPVLGRATRSYLAVALVLLATPGLGMARAPSVGPPSSDCTEAFAGDYAVRHMEMGGGLALHDDGSFGYEMAYGAVDEVAQGRWTCDKNTVFLTSNPVNPPRFSMLGADPAPKGELHVELDLPRGMSRQYFSVLIRKADGSTEQREFGEDGLVVAFTAQERPVTIVPLLPVYELAGDPITLPAGEGLKVRLQFLPNDLGRVAFSRTPLQQQARGLSLQRFGETILLQRSSTPPAHK